jgi:hypothetical protein
MSAHLFLFLGISDSLQNRQRVRHLGRTLGLRCRVEHGGRAASAGNFEPTTTPTLTPTKSPLTQHWRLGYPKPTALQR